MSNPIRIACPKCSVKPGVSCLSSRGKIGTINRPHKERFAAARAPVNAAGEAWANGVTPSQAASLALELPAWRVAALAAASALEQRAHEIRNAARMIDAIIAKADRTEADGVRYDRAWKILDGAGIAAPRSEWLSW